jgi:hypothetical protein
VNFAGRLIDSVRTVPVDPTFTVQGTLSFLSMMLAGMALWSPRVCDPVWLPVSRPTGGAFFVATVSDSVAGGWRATIDAGGGASPGLPNGPALLIPWSYGPDCTPQPWKPGTGWQPPRTSAFYTAHLRHRDSWRVGLPTFDVYMASREPMWQSDEPRWPRSKPGETLLTPREFFELYAGLPTEEELNEDRALVLSRAAQWAEEHPQLAAREPARTIWANVRRAADDTMPQSAIKISLDFPHGAVGVHVERDGGARLSYGALPASRAVAVGTFDIDALLRQLLPRIHRVVPAEARLLGKPFGGVTIWSTDGRSRSYLLYDGDYAAMVFKTACRHRLSRDDAANDPFERLCADIVKRTP